LATSSSDLTIRPVRPSDRERVLEITRDVWAGRDYVPRVFDAWVGDAAAAFQALEVDGEVVGVQRLRPYAPGLVWYEGLRVAPTHRRQGLARTMLDSAIAEAREQGFKEMRLATQSEPAANLFESAGFQRVIDIRWWRAPRLEGGEPARIPDPAAAGKLWPAVLRSPGFELYRGVSADLGGARDIEEKELERLAANGMLRVVATAVAGLREAWGPAVAVSFISGRGATLRDLLYALRYEADADGLERVTVAVPRDHPAADDLQASGYDFASVEDSAYIFSLKLTRPSR
jgi:N-acetylglutamate synthase-like GNAT family acetyltransferase